MEKLDHIYTRGFFEEWGPRHKKYVESARIIADILYRHIKPDSLIDIGCGCGIYSHLFNSMGVKTTSLDGVQPPPDLCYPVEITIQDITQPFLSPWRPFGVSLCLEVAEHIPPEYVEIFIANIIQFSDQLIISAAPPGQGGHFHVNEQPKRFWVKALAAHGFIYNRQRTGVFLEEFKKTDCPYKWMGEHISFYEKLKPTENVKRDYPFSTRMDVIHSKQI